MPTTIFHFEQDMFKHSQPPITVTSIHENEALKHLPDFLGVAGAYDKCRLAMLALASDTNVLLVRLSSGKTPNKDQPSARPGRHALCRSLLEVGSYRKAGFNADRLALALFGDLNARIDEFIDLRVLSPAQKSAKESLNTIAQALGGWELLLRPRFRQVFADEKYQPDDLKSLALRAWASYKAAVSVRAIEPLDHAPKIDTTVMLEAVGSITLANSLSSAHRFGNPASSDACQVQTRPR
jgi:hypothetical protein